MALLGATVVSSLVCFYNTGTLYQSIKGTAIEMVIDTLKYAAIGGLGLIVLVFMFVRLQERNVFLPLKYESSRLESLPSGVEFIRFRNGSGQVLTGLWRPGEAPAGTVILAHGNAGHMLDRMYWLTDVVPGGWNAMVFDYRGYGLSEGDPSEQGIYRDATAAVGWTRRRSNNLPVVFHGRSLGVTAATFAAADPEAGTSVKGLILDSGFPSAEAMARTILPLPGIGWFLTMKLDAASYLEQQKERHGPVPKLFIHGGNDRVVPPGMGKRLFEEAPPPKQRYVVPGAGHNNLWEVGGQEYVERIRDFLNTVVPRTSPPDQA